MVGRKEIIGSGGNKLEIHMLPNNDIMVGTTDTEGRVVYSDFPNPFTGGGDRDAYKALLKVYEAMPD